MGSLQENQKFCEYLEKSVTPFHCVLNSEKILNQNGFCELNTESKWKLKKGGKYYWKFNDSYLFAFSVGTMWSEGQGFKLAAAHGDSPCFRIRSGKDKRMGQYVFLNTEGYGGANFTSWIDRPLSVAGRVCLKSKYDKKVDVRILDMERAIAIIPGLAVHFTKEDYEYQEKNSKRIPLFAITENTEMSDKMFEKMVADELEVEPEDILDYELYVYHYAKSEIIGMKEELLALPRLDNQTGTYGIIQAIAGTENETGISAAVIFDNEEVGNISKNGAFSRVTSTILKLIYEGLGCNELQYDKELLKSNIISVDAAHGFHPVFATHYDKEHMCILNRGFCIKQASSQAYATDSTMSGMIQQLCRKENIPFQKYMNHADIRGGGTLGSIISCVLGVKTADIGVPILSMHSSLETMGMEDENSLIHFLRIYYDAM